MSVNTLELHARELLGKGEDWKLYLYESLPEPKDGQKGWKPTHFQLTGAIPSAVLFKSGPRKGKPYPKFHTDQATAIIAQSDHGRWEREWEAKTGICTKCAGTGQMFIRWSVETGNSYAPCSKCKKGTP